MLSGQWMCSVSFSHFSILYSGGNPRLLWKHLTFWCFINNQFSLLLLLSANVLLLLEFLICIDLFLLMITPCVLPHSPICRALLQKDQNAYTYIFKGFHAFSLDYLRLNFSYNQLWDFIWHSISIQNYTFPQEKVLFWLNSNNYWLIFGQFFSHSC